MSAIQYFIKTKSALASIEGTVLESIEGMALESIKGMALERVQVYSRPNKCAR